jgi:hypothetical protein
MEEMVTVGRRKNIHRTINAGSVIGSETRSNIKRAFPADSILGFFLSKECTIVFCKMIDNEP